MISLGVSARDLPPPPLNRGPTAGAGDIVFSPRTYDLRVALAGNSLPVVTMLNAQCTHWGTAGSASAAPRAARSAPMARALRARTRAASLIAVSRSALRARRRGRCAPFAPGRAATGCHRRLALRARRRWHRRAARPGAFGSPVERGLALRARRRGRCAPGRLHVPPDHLRALPLGGGDDEDVVRCALLETLGATRASSPAEGEGGEGRSRHYDAQVCGERLRAAAACAMRVGATRHWKGSAFPPGQGRRSPAL